MINAAVFSLSFFLFVDGASRCTTSDNCCVVGSSCPTCSATTATTQRLRKEIRTLSSAEFSRFSAALNTMKDTSMDDGKALFGSSFRSYDYFVAKHLAASLDTRGDQGHFNSAFMTFHSLLLLEFENALLAVDSEVGALPYWNWNDTSTSVFTSTMFGEAPGTGTNKQVSTGKFAYWPVQKMSSSIWSSTYSQYLTDSSYLSFNGSTASGYLRGATNALTNADLTRYGSSPTKGTGSTSCTGYSTFPWINWYSCIEVMVLGAP
jgi:hypothetical protein